MNQQGFDLGKPYLEGLTHRQKLFVLLYDGNATETAKRAGYKGSYNALAVTGHRLLKNPKVKAAIAKKYNGEEQGKTEILSRERKRRILAEIAENSTNPGRLRIDALNEDNKMTGQHKQVLEVETNIRGLSDSQLRQHMISIFLGLGVTEAKALEIMEVLENSPQNPRLLGIGTGNLIDQAIEVETTEDREGDRQ